MKRKKKEYVCFEIGILLKKMFQLTLKIIRIFFILITILLFYFIVIPSIYDSEKLKNFSDQLFLCSMPENTKIVETYSSAANYANNGDNSCYIAIALIESELSAEELYAYFEAQKFKNALVEADNYLALMEVQKAEAGKEAKSTFTYHTFPFAYVMENDDVEDMYYVIIYDQESVTSIFAGMKIWIKTQCFKLIKASSLGYSLFCMMI